MAWYRFATGILDEYARLSNEYRQYSFAKDIRFVLDRNFYTLEYTIFRLTYSCISITSGYQCLYVILFYGVQLKHEQEIKVSKVKTKKKKEKTHK